MRFAIPLALLSAFAAAAQDKAFEDSVKPFFSNNCIKCHSSQLKSGDVDLESYRTAASIASDPDTWERVVLKLRTGEMPPPGMPRPDPAAVKLVSAWIESEIARVEGLAEPNPGRVTARRLNRAEYNNTIRDLLGLDFGPADDFPQDDSGYGFDNIGDVLSLPPVLMEKYLASAERIVQTALFGPGKLKPAVSRHQPPNRRLADGGSSVVLGPLPYTATDYDVTGLSLPSSIHVMHRFPVDGEYVFRISPSGNRPLPSTPFQIALWIDGKQHPETVEFQGIPDGVGLEGQNKEIRMRVRAGERWLAVSVLRQFEGLPARYGGLNPMAPPPAPQGASKKKGGGRQPSNKLTDITLRMNFLDVIGPFNQTEGPAAETLKKIFVCGHADGKHQAGCDRRIIANLAGQAYRRPVARAEIDRLVNLGTGARKLGQPFEQGIGAAMTAILVSPHFLFRLESQGKRAGSTYPIGQHELASRLSYFLWASMPDEELLRSADRGALRQPAVLAAQVRRMLKDPKSRALVENFGGQWLQFRALESVKPDRERFPEFEEYLRMSMRRETELFFESIVREDRSILDFIDGKYTFLNERLGQFYEVPDVKGPEFRRVELSGGQRSGVLTQASVLTVSSYATRTSPVLRGKWILENILNAPPPPPPPDVPSLDEGSVGALVSLRQQLEKHREDAACASCHSRMDPLGFALENYDATGAWRTSDGKFPIDASGTLPDGRSFAGPADLKALLKTNPGAFAECMSDKLLTYALGRGLERYDRPTVKAIADAAAKNDYRFSNLVLEIVKSLPFQMSKTD